MSENLVTYVRGVSDPGPNAQAVSLGLDADGVALWTWVGRDEVVVAGMTFSCESVSFGEVQKTYTKKDENGNEVEIALRRPKRQVRMHAVPVFDAPKAQEVVSEVIVTDAALEFAKRVRAKAAPVGIDDVEPF